MALFNLDSLSRLYSDGAAHDNSGNLANSLNRLPGGDIEQNLASGNLSLNTYISTLAVSGTVAYTLPDGLYVGQKKLIVCVSAASTPVGVLTITTPETTAGAKCAASFCFDAVGQAVELEWKSAGGVGWRATRVYRAGGSGVDGVVVGTTVINGTGATLKNLWATYTLSVTATVSSTTTKAIPDGSAVGEVIQVGCSTAASTPSGTIACTGITTLGASGTKTLGTFNATTVWASLMWTGTAWMQLGGVTAVLS